MSTSKTDGTGREKKLDSQIKGLTLERKVSNWLLQQGWANIQWRKMVKGREIDLFATRESLLASKEYCLVECKACDVTHAHVVKFLAVINQFYQGLPGNEFIGKPRVTAYIATTGKVPADAKNAVKGNAIPIVFKSF